MEKKIQKAKRKEKVVETKVKLPLKKAAPIKEKKKTPVSVITQGASLFNLTAPLGSHKHRKIKGRGPSSGHGKTSTRGSKGQTSRAGRHFYSGFEGGQSPLMRRMPKRGFTSIFKKEYQIVKLGDLNRIKETPITLELLEKKGLIKDRKKPVKILGDGEVKNPLTVQAHAFSQKASQQIVNAGGKIEVIN